MKLSKLSKVSLKLSEILKWLLTHGEMSLVGDVWSANVDLSMPPIPWLIGEYLWKKKKPMKSPHFT